MPRLQEGCFICDNLREPPNLLIAETRTSIAKLNPDQMFKGYTFLILKWHQEHLHQLTEKDRISFLDDMANTSRALQTSLHPDRINYELLGNAQPHLHWHLIPRYETDPMWGRPIWAGSRGRKRLTQDGYAEIIKKIQSKLARTGPKRSK